MWFKLDTIVMMWSVSVSHRKVGNSWRDQSLTLDIPEIQPKPFFPLLFAALSDTSALLPIKQYKHKNTEFLRAFTGALKGIASSEGVSGMAAAVRLFLQRL
jgi:hypothetical protein